MIKFFICFSILIIFNLSCKKNTSPSEPAEQWIENPELIYEMVAKVDSSKIREHMINITSYVNRGNESNTINELRNWIKDYCEQFNLNVEYLPYVDDQYQIYFSGKNGFLLGPHDYSTHDNGNSWQLTDYPSHSAIYFLNENTGFMIVGNDVWATIDGGINWEVRAQGLGGYSIYFIDELHGWLFFNKSVYVSQDGGYNWTIAKSFSSVTSNLYKMFSIDSSHMWIAGKGIVLVTDNGWQSWHEISQGLIARDYHDIYFVNELEGWVWQNQSDYRRTIDGGLTWTRDNLLNDNYVDVIVGVYPKYVWACEWHGRLYISSDSGNSWQESLTSGWTPGLFFLNNLTGWASTALGIYKTNDGGISWKDQIDHLHDSATWKNILIKIPGQKYPQKEVLLIAHYDSNAGQGADDNASGMSALLEFVRILSDYKFAHTIKIIFFSGEEVGLKGSRYYAYTAKLENENISAVLNFDVIGYWEESLPRDLNIIYNSNSEDLVNNCLSAISEYTSKQAVKNTSFGPQSDHESFWIRDYPAVWFCEAGSRTELSPYANLRQDVIETIDFPFLYDNIEAAVAAVASIAIPVEEK